MRKVTLMLCGLLGVLILLVIIWNVHDEYQVYKKGDLILATIVKLPPKSNFSKGSGVMTFSYNNNLYTKVIPEKNTHYLGEKITLRYLKGYEDDFLYSFENPATRNALPFIGAVAYVIACICYAFKKQPMGSG